MPVLPPITDLLRKRGVDPADLSDPVMRLAIGLYGRKITASDIANAVFKQHPLYFSSWGRGVVLDDVGPKADIAEWIARVRKRFPRAEVAHLDIELLLYGLSLVDDTLRRQLIERELFVPLEHTVLEPGFGTSPGRLAVTAQEQPAVASPAQATGTSSAQPTETPSEQAATSPGQPAPDDAPPPQLTFEEVTSPYGDRFYKNTTYVFIYAAELAYFFGREVDCAVVLAALFDLAQDDAKDTGYHLCKLFLDKIPSPPENTSTLSNAAASLMLGVGVFNVAYPPRPNSDSTRWLKATVADEVKQLLSYAEGLQTSSNEHSQIYPRHLIGALLKPTFDNTALRRLYVLGFGSEYLRRRLVRFMAEQHPQSEDPKAWERFFEPFPAEQKPEEELDGGAGAAGDAAAAEVESASVLHASASDQPAAKDSIGFSPYVAAMAEFLMNEGTRPPLTLSIEGEWGSGKSSFMLQLESHLNLIVRRKRVGMAEAVRGEIRRRRRFVPRALRPLKIFRRLMLPKSARAEVLSAVCPTVRYNAWRYDKDEALWASFVLEFISRLKRELPWPARVRAYLRLLWLRFNWADGWLVLLRAALLGAVFVTLTGLVAFLLFSGGLEGVLGTTPAPRVAAPGPTSAPAPAPDAGKDKDKDKDGEELKPEAILIRLIRGSGVVGYLVLVILLAVKFSEQLGNPLSTSLREYVNSPNYKSRVAFIDNFHEDFRKVVETYAGTSKVFVFIDDLDRCEVPKAADLMQALNLMIADSPQLIFIIGMDREKVAAGLAVKYEKMLPYLAPPLTPAAFRKAAGADAGRQNGGGQTAPAFDPTGGLEYGFSFIEKFIQLPFRIPQPGEPDVRRLLRSINEEKPPPLKKRPGRRWGARHAPAAVATQPAASPSAAQTTETNAAAAGDASASQPRRAETEGRTQETGTQEERQQADPQGAAQLTPEQRAEQERRERQAEDRRKFKLDAFEDSEQVRKIVLFVSKALDNNPRRLKQFVNAFRLNAYIAAETGLNELITLQQLGKFVALGLRWPHLLVQMEADPELLRDLHDYSLQPDSEVDSKKETVNHWRQRPELMRLLSHRCTTNGAGAGKVPPDAQRYSLRDVDVSILLSISAKAVAPAAVQAADAPASSHA
ncbi:MAG TPA: P-loop NTPase fold protein [Pyrinomonadaceae bacterium]|nr:P-loop NTPase fold protein [Pyrinomonadaceae bacterium]